MRTQCLRVWSRFAPLWVALWLLSPILGSAEAWTHNDGSLCLECPQQAPVLVQPDECCPAEVGLAAPVSTDCTSCCTRAERTESPVFASVAAPAVLPSVAIMAVAFEVKTFVRPPIAEWAFDAAPRGPPRGRAPPEEISFRF